MKCAYCKADDDRLCANWKEADGCAFYRRLPKGVLDNAARRREGLKVQVSPLPDDDPCCAEITATQEYPAPNPAEWPQE